MPGPLLVKTGALWQGIRADRAKCWLPGTQCEKNAVRAKFSFFACYNLDIECILCIIVNNAASLGASIGQDTGALTPWTLLLFTDTLTQQQCFITIQFNALKTHQGGGEYHVVIPSSVFSPATRKSQALFPRHVASSLFEPAPLSPLSLHLRNATFTRRSPGVTAVEEGSGGGRAPVTWWLSSSWIHQTFTWSRGLDLLAPGESLAREERGLFYALTQIFLAPFIAYRTDLLSTYVFW